MFPASVTWTGLKILRKEKCEFIPRRVIISHNESKHKYITSMWPFSICPFCASLCFKWELRKLKASKGIHRDFFFLFFFGFVESFQILAIISCDAAKLFIGRYRNSKCFFNLVGNVLWALEYLCSLNHSSLLLAIY